MENQNENTRPGATPAPAADGIRDTMETAADALEAQIEAAERAAQAMSTEAIVETLKATSDHHAELAGSADEEDTARACLIQSAAIWRAAKIIERTEAALAGLAAQEDWDAGTLSDFADELREILEGGAL